VQNPVGKLLGPWDDRGSVEPGDDYVRDDFLVDDGEGEDEDEDSQEEGSGSESDDSNDDRGFDDDFQDEEVYDDSEAGDLNGSGLQIGWPSRTSADASQTSESDSDDDTPLGELPNKIRAKRVSGKRKAGVAPSPGLGSDDDIATQPPRKRHKGADHLRGIYAFSKVPRWQV
jgi:hypothetical protein